MKISNGVKNNISVSPSTTLNNKTGGWRTNRPKFIHDKCTACGICPRVCPEGIIEKFTDEARPYYKCDLTYCKGCGLCASECPVKAIVMEMEEK